MAPGLWPWPHSLYLCFRLNIFLKNTCSHCLLFISWKGQCVCLDFGRITFSLNRCRDNCECACLPSVTTAPTAVCAQDRCPCRGLFLKGVCGLHPHRSVCETPLVHIRPPRPAPEAPEGCRRWLPVLPAFPLRLMAPHVRWPSTCPPTGSACSCPWPIFLSCSFCFSYRFI